MEEVIKSGKDNANPDREKLKAVDKKLKEQEEYLEKSRIQLRDLEDSFKYAVEALEQVKSYGGTSAEITPLPTNKIKTINTHDINLEELEIDITRYSISIIIKIVIILIQKRS